MSKLRPCFVLLLLLLALAAISRAQEESRFRVATYNVENLFDTIPSPRHGDSEFLPAAERAWHSGRYWKKLGMLARAIAAIGDVRPAALVALCEVEGDTVLTHLTRRTALARLGYEYAVTHSADERGMNVALLYQPELFRPLSVASLRVPYRAGKERPTRDVLHVAGQCLTGDTLDVFVCHFPSRRGGTRLTDPYRRRAAETVRRAADSLLAVRGRHNIIIMGDFNAYYPERCIAETLGAIPAQEVQATGGAFLRENLYLLTHGLKADGGIGGTYKYKGEWQTLDQIIVSGTLLCAVPGHLFTKTAACRLCAFPFLLKNDRSGTPAPYRTYLGTFYQGGYSDHLPVALDFFE
ncbi:MAG: endonuclease/exonuclease/phosphatase family protein [Alloprevotella sp.]